VSIERVIGLWCVRDGGLLEGYFPNQLREGNKLTELDAGRTFLGRRGRPASARFFSFARMNEARRQR
jgi:hypothetical protein